MGKSLFRAAVVSLFFAVVLLGGYSCSPSEDYLDEYEVKRMIEEALRNNNQDIEFTKWKIVNIEVKKKDWFWIDEENVNRYEAIFDLPELTRKIYEEGAVLGYVFLGQQDVDEVQKTLPYLHTYEANPPYTETISFDVQYMSKGKVKPSVAFYIQPSDLIREDDYLYDTINFRIVLVWN